MMNKYEELRRKAEAATPGPWRWELNEKHKNVELCGGRPQYDRTVMGFWRYGMNGAAPCFPDAKHPHQVLRRADEFSSVVAGREHHAHWFKNIDNPNAAFIAAANPAVVLELLDELKAARAALRWADTSHRGSCGQYSICICGKVEHAAAIEAALKEGE